MKKKDEWFRVSYDTRQTSELRIEKDFKIREEIKIYNKEKEVVRNWTDLSNDDNKVEIILTVQGDGQENWRDDYKNDITYYLKESAKQNGAEQDKALKEANSHFLKKKKPELIGSEQEYRQSDEIKWFLRGEPNNFSMELIPNNVTSGTKQVKNEKIKIKVKFILANEISPEEILDPFPPSPQSKWGWGKITLVAILVTALLLVIIFWKKIWRWIKGESKQEKKVREQIDIF